MVAGPVDHESSLAAITSRSSRMHCLSSWSQTSVPLEVELIMLPSNLRRGKVSGPSHTTIRPTRVASVLLLLPAMICSYVPQSTRPTAQFPSLSPTFLEVCGRACTAWMPLSACYSASSLQTDPVSSVLKGHVASLTSDRQSWGDAIRSNVVGGRTPLRPSWSCVYKPPLTPRTRSLRPSPQHPRAMMCQAHHSEAGTLTHRGYVHYRSRLSCLDQGSHKDLHALHYSGAVD